MAEPFVLHVDQYYCLYDPLSAIDNVEMQPDGVSDAGTAFTRYTVAPTTIATTRITSFVHPSFFPRSELITDGETIKQTDCSIEEEE